MSEEQIQDHHAEECECGCHDHEHGHHHHDNDHVHAHDEDGIHIEHHTVDDAQVISGTVRFAGDYEAVRLSIKEELEALAAQVTQSGGIVGHIKAAAEVTQTEMFSVTEADAMIKATPTQDITVKLAAIVFLVEPQDVELLVGAALRTLRGD